MLYAEVQPVFANLFAKIVIIREFSLNLHPNLTKVDSRHDSTNHASMFFAEPYPARSAVAVKTQPKGALVEIEVVAEVS